MATIFFFFFLSFLSPLFKTPFTRAYLSSTASPPPLPLSPHSGSRTNLAGDKMQHGTQCSILMLKEPSSTPDATGQEQLEDKYEAALQSAFAKDDAVHLDLIYVAPLTILPKEPSLLSESIAAGPPPLGRDHRGKDDPTTAEVWAFAVTSQNAVRSFVQALERQTNLGKRRLWMACRSLNYSRI